MLYFVGVRAGFGCFKLGWWTWSLDPKEVNCSFDGGYNGGGN
jgi:hypothetical protein